MKQALISALVAAIVAVVTVRLTGTIGGDAAPASAPQVLSFTMEGIEDSIVRGPGEYSQLLVEAENSICYLTKVQFRAIETPEDSNICSIQLDEFTGHWTVTATVEEGSGSEARCNARCLVWD